MVTAKEDLYGHTFEEHLDSFLGPIGTPRRDAFEAKLAKEVSRAELREARKQARKAKLQSLVTPIVNAINKVTEGQAEVART